MKNFYYAIIIFSFSLCITAQTTTPTGNSSEVGITEGQLSVSLSGGANYAIPIAVPPGINGVVPQVSLVYNSQGGNGIAGYGWNIAGVSAITRIPSTKFHDGTIDAVDFDYSDRFALDGQRLILKSGTYGMAGAVYETENFSNLKIETYSIAGNPTRFYFKVFYPDGSNAIYNAENTGTSLNYLIRSWSNAQGLTIVYSYIYDGNYSYIDKIQYGHTTAGTPINTIQFNYVSRYFEEQSYIGGIPFKLSKILNSINVIGNGVGFRNYELLSETTTSYSRLKSITEKSGDGSKSYNPTAFSYETNDKYMSYAGDITSNVDIGSISSQNAETVSGDFNGDEKMEFLIYPTTGQYAKSKYWFYSDINSGPTNLGVEHNVGAFENIFPVSWLTLNNKLHTKQGWAVAQKTDTSYTITVYGAGSSSPIFYQYERVVNFPTQSVASPGFCKLVNSNKIFPKKILSGDFNGDGLTDVIAIDMDLETFSLGTSCKFFSSKITSKKVYFVDLKRDNTTNFLTFSGELAAVITSSSRVEVADVNGDGKSDFIIFENGKATTYTLDDANQLILLWNYSDTNITIDSKTLLLGDFNGDGKTDFIIPVAYGNSLWYKYTSTGNNFIKEILNGGATLYRQDNNLSNYNYITSDFNKDGKSDLIEVLGNKDPSASTRSIRLTCHYNVNGSFDGVEQAYTKLDASINAFPLPIFISTTKGLQTSGKPNNITQQISFLSNNKIFSFYTNKDSAQNQLVRSITTGNGVRESITYQPLSPNSLDEYGNPIYINGYSETYPKIDIESAATVQVVTKLEKQSASLYKKQLFAYAGATSNLEGLGFMGYRASMRTNWFVDNNQIISSISKFDSNLRSANIENYSYLGLTYPAIAINNTAPNVPRISKITVSNTRTATETLLATNNITFLPGATIKPAAGNTFIAKVTNDYDANGFAETNTTPAYNLISKSLSFYESSLSPTKVFKLQNIQSNNYNILENTSSETNIVYDGDNNPTESITKLRNGGTTEQTTTSVITYQQAATSPYAVGRPISKTQTVTSSGNSMNTKEAYEYGTGTESNLLKKIDKWGNDTSAITENNVYDTFGNITKKTITALGLTPRITNYTYDSSGRFLTKSFDIENLSTTFDYNPSSGVLNFEINPYGLKTTYEYDSWFKQTKTIDYLGKSNNYSYTRNGNINTLVTTTGDDGSGSQELFDDLGRKIKTGVKDITGTMSNVDYKYDIYDRNFQVSEPYYGASASQYNTTEYDVYGRVIKSTSFTGKIVNINYSGLTTTVNDGSKTKTSTKNAIGNVVSMTDSPGGTINYTYFANGNLKSSNYDGVTTTIEQDGWGRKTKLTDPSAGIYSYAYNGFGETISETTPNGTTTYELDDFGKLKKKTISGGANSNSVSDYVYDGASKLLLSSTFNDIKEGTLTNYNYNYDSSKRILSTTESTPFYGTTFTKLVSYDLFGRVEYETSTAAIGGKSSAKKIKNVYKNGSPWQIIDDATQLVLWQTNTVNARGQLTGASLGNGINITNTYDQYGFAKEFKHDKTGGSPVNVMTLTTHFDEKKGNLKDRTNSLFTNGLEVFEYDALDRLTKYPNALGQQVTQDYDARGRITQNTLGTYNYDSGKPYQNKEILLTPEAYGYYADREGVFNDSMEEKTGWDNGAYNAAAISFDNTIAHTGNNSLKINTTGTGYAVSYVQSNKVVRIDNATDTEYTFTGWVKSDSPTAQLTLFEYKEGETASFTKVESVSTTTTGQWVPMTKTVLVPANIKYLNLRADNVGTGSVWFDDVQIRKTSNASTAVRNLNIDYNTYKSPVRIEETGVDIINFAYNDSNSRSVMFYGSLDALAKDRPYRKFYSADGTMEIKENRVTGVMEFVTYIGGDGYSAPVVLKSDGTTQNYLYLHRDYQGSIVAITNASGAVVEKRQFDAWGAIIKVQDGAGNALSGLTILDRGYTGHEHLQSVGLIHMNGRLYDPKLHRFLQPDNFVQDPSNTQNYNRYGYVLNNPLKYTDPSGEFKINWNDVIAGAAIVVGAVLTATGYGTVVGIPLMGAGLAHFGAAYAEYSKTGDWNAASNNAGFIVSYSQRVDWLDGGPAKTDVNGVAQDQYIKNKPTPVTITRDDQSNAAMSYYNALDGIVFNNGSVKTKNDFYLTFNSEISANASYHGFKNGKYNINFDIGDFELTVSNIRAEAIHEAYGHGYMNYNNANRNHYKAYEASIDSKYWQSTTYKFKYHVVTQMWSYYYKEVGYKPMASKYQNEYDKYNKYKR